MRFAGFVGPSYVAASKNYDAQRCINLYAELNEIGSGKSREVAVLLGTPGLETLVTVGDGPIRGSWVGTKNGVLYVVSGDKFYSVDSSWAATELGTLNTSSGRVGIADNGIDLMIVDGTDGWNFTIATAAFAQVTDIEFLGADQVIFQDGYFIFKTPDAGTFSLSGINEVTFDGLDFATAEGWPDNLVSILSDHRELWLFGDQTTEVWYNSGNSDFPFQRVEGSFIEHGCAAAWSPAKLNNTVFWLGQDRQGKGVIYMAEGFQPQRISTHAVEFAIQGYSDISDATGYAYQENGHFFYVLNFPSGGISWCFDTSTKLWHERAYLNDGQLERHRADLHSFVYNTHVVGDYESGKLYSLNSSYYSDGGAPLARIRRTPHLSEMMDRLFYKEFQIEMETGTGLDGTGQGTDPQAMLRFSDDGGHTWSNEKWTSFGKIGKRLKRAIWRRLGASRTRIFEVVITDPVKVAIIGAEIDYEKGGS